MAQIGGFFTKKKQSKNDDIFLKTYRIKNYDFTKFMLDNNMVSDLGHSDCYGNTILHYAVVTNNLPFIAYFLNLCNNDRNIINKANNEGDTPLHIAVRKQFDSITEELVKRGANTSIKNKKGEYIAEKQQDNNILNSIPKLWNSLKPKNVHNSPNVKDTNISTITYSDSNNSNRSENEESIGDTDELLKLLHEFGMNMTGGKKTEETGVRKIRTTLTKKKK